MSQLIVITGASSGIGSATSQAFHAAGHRLLLLARREEPMRALGLEGAEIRAVDVRNTAAVAAAISDAEAIHGPVDLLVNNAGVMQLGTVDKQDPAEWRQMFEVNCIALMEVGQLVLGTMLERGAGTIVNIGSIAGRNVYGDHAVYCGTKFAVHAMTEQMRKEAAPAGVRISLVAPGMVETELLEHTTDPAALESYLAYKKTIGAALPAEHVGRAILNLYELPQEVCIRELVIAPTCQDA